MLAKYIPAHFPFFISAFPISTNPIERDLLGCGRAYCSVLHAQPFPVHIAISGFKKYIQCSCHIVHYV